VAIVMTPRGWLRILTAVALTFPIPGAAKAQTIRHHKIAETDPSVEELQRAEDLIEKKDYEGAQPILLKLTATDNTNYEAWFDLGFVYSAEGDSKDSIAAYRQSVAAKPDVFESNLNLGLMLAKANDPESEKFLRAATTLKPTARMEEGQERAWLSLAHVIESTKPDDALEAYRQAAALQPKDAEPHLSAAMLLEKGNHFADAMSEYQKALDLDPSSSKALSGLANVSMRSQQFGDAEKYLRQILAQHPDDATAQLQLARVLAAQKKDADSLSLLEQAAKKNPADLTLQSDLLQAYMNLKKFDLAESIYRQQVRLHPNDAELRARLGFCLLKEKRYGEAQQSLLQAVQLKPNYGEAYGDLAIAASEGGQYELAIRAVEARDHILPPLPTGYFLRASAYDHLRDYKDAALNYHKFLELDGGKYPDQEWQARHRLIAIEPKK